MTHSVARPNWKVDFQLKKVIAPNPVDEKESYLKNEWTERVEHKGW